MSIKSIVWVGSILIANISEANNDLAKNILQSEADIFVTSERPGEICKSEFAEIPETSCIALVNASVKSISGSDYDKANLKDTIKKDFSSPEYLNSALRKYYSDDNPFGLTFVSLDSKLGEESILGLSYSLDHNFYKETTKRTNKHIIEMSGSFIANGTVVNDATTNPRNFLESKLAVSRSYTTNIPDQDLSFATKIMALSLDEAAKCNTERATEECSAAQNATTAVFDSTSEFLTSFQYFGAGLDVGYEADQRFENAQETVGAFVFGQYEDWGTNTWAGSLRITPSIRLAIDKVEPNKDTPRAKAGDDSSFYRFVGEVSAWIPVGSYSGKSLVFTANYRTYRELSPSGIVEAANLDNYNLRTFSLTAPNGLFVSYSSGMLPLDQQNDDVVALGFETYF